MERSLVWATVGLVVGVLLGVGLGVRIQRKLDTGARVGPGAAVAKMGVLENGPLMTAGFHKAAAGAPASIVVVRQTVVLAGGREEIVVTAIRGENIVDANGAAPTAQQLAAEFARATREFPQTWGECRGWTDGIAAGKDEIGVEVREAK